MEVCGDSNVVKTAAASAVAETVAADELLVLRKGERRGGGWMGEAYIAGRKPKRVPVGLLFEMEWRGARRQ